MNGKRGKVYNEIETLQFNPITSPISNFPEENGDRVLDILFKHVHKAYVNGNALPPFVRLSQ